MNVASRTPGRLLVAVGVALGLSVWAALPASSQDRPLDTGSPAHAAAAASAEQDLKSLAGRWERSLAGDDDARGAAKAIKEIAGNRETVTYVNDAGEAVYATSAEFKLEQSGRVKLYAYSDFKVTRGKDDGGGDRGKGPVSYIYRVEDDLYHEAHGLLVDSPPSSRPVVVTWKRVR